METKDKNEIIIENIETDCIVEVSEAINEEKNEEIEQLTKTIDKVETLSPSQQDRLALDTTRDLNLVNFINAQLSKIQQKDNLKTTILNRLKLLVDNNDVQISVPAMIKILEILDKSDSEVLVGVLNAAQAASLANSLFGKGKEEKSPDKKEPETEYSVEDLKAIKSVLSLFKKLDKEV